MTPVHRRLLDFISTFTAEHGFAPSYEEMGVAMGWKSKSNANRALCEMKRRGLVDFDPNHARTVRVIPQKEASGRVQGLVEAAQLVETIGPDGRRYAAIIRARISRLEVTP